MDCASSYLYLKKRKQENEEDNEDFDDGKLSVCSDELNRSFNSDDEDEECEVQDNIASQNFLSMNGDFPMPRGEEMNMRKLEENAVRLESDNILFAKECSKKSSGGFFGAIGRMFGSSKAAAPKECAMRSAPMSMPAKAPKPRAAKVKADKGRFNRQGRKFKNEVDTNVISLNLQVLKEDAELAAGDPVFCEH